MTEPYGLPADININYKAPGFPAWVDALCRQWGLDSSTYAGHQTSDRPDIGAAPNPDGLNRGIDWAGPEQHMLDFAHWLCSIAPDRSPGVYGPPGIEMVIHENPDTGEQIGYPSWVDFGSDYSGHRDHVHTRFSAAPVAAPSPPPSVMTVPLVQNLDGTWGSPNPAWNHLIMRESGGDPTIIQQIIDVNSGGNEAEGLFQIAKSTWQDHNGTEFAPTPRLATPQQQALVAARIFLANPSGSDWGAGLPGREDPQQLAAGLMATQGEDDIMAGVNVEGLNTLVDKFLTTWPSRSMFTDSNNPVDDGVGLLLNVDGNTWNVPMILGSLLGVPYAVQQVDRMARGDFPAGSHVATDPWLRQIAQDFAVKLQPLYGSLAHLGPAVVTPTPVPEPVPEPTPDNGSKSYGPAGWIFVGGLVINVAIWGLQHLIPHLPSHSAAIAASVVSVLAAIGGWLAPSTKKEKPIAPDVQPSTPPPSPIPPEPLPTPQPTPAPVPPPTSPDPVLPTGTEHAADAVAAEIADLADREVREVEELRDRIKETLKPEKGAHEL